MRRARRGRCGSISAKIGAVVLLLVACYGRLPSHHIKRRPLGRLIRLGLYLSAAYPAKSLGVRRAGRGFPVALVRHGADDPQLWYITSHNDGIEREVFEANLAHAVAIYQSFKYLILACAVGATFKGLYLAVKNFARSGPYN